jgi:hypothetical protein
MAAVLPISRSHATASGLRYKVAASALAAAAAMALLRLTGLAPGAEHTQNPPRQSRFSSTLPRQLQTARVTAVVPEGSTRNTCVMALGRNGKLSVGFGEPSHNTIVSLTACDLYNASRETGSTELLEGASLTARNIFLSGGYALSAGSVMTASRYLTTHTSPVADPYLRLEVPSYPGCTRTRYRLDERKTETISPGIYCGGIEVAGGATLSLDPGTYILDRGNFAVGGNSTVNGTGVTLVLTSRTGSNYGAINIRAGSTVTITAPALGAAAGIPGIAIWVDGDQPAAIDTFEGGSTQNINGAIYLPHRQVNYSGGAPSATRCSQLIAQAVTFTGNSYFRHDCQGAGLSDPDPPLLLAE